MNVIIIIYFFGGGVLRNTNNLCFIQILKPNGKMVELFQTRNKHLHLSF